MLKTGIYRHFKGKEYLVAGVAKADSTKVFGKRGSFCTARNSEKPTETFKIFRNDEGFGHAYYLDAIDGRDWVVYQARYGDMDWWIRPLEMFTQTVTRDGYNGPRFEFLRDK